LDDIQKALENAQVLTSKRRSFMFANDRRREPRRVCKAFFPEKVMAHAKSEGAQAVAISAQIESEMAVSWMMRNRPGISSVPSANGTAA